MTRRARSRGDDAGFTLPELLISIVILSFIVGAIGFTLTVVLRNTRATSDRSVSNLSAQALSAWFTGDVQSAVADGGGDTTPAGDSGCVGGPDPGANVLTLQRAGAGGLAVSYRLVADGTEFQLVRVTCPTGTRIHNVVAQGIAAPAAVVVEPAAMGPATLLDVVRLSVSVGTVDPTTVSVSGTVRTRPDGFPSACSLVAATPQNLAVALGQLLTDAAFQVHVAGDCGPLSLTVDRGAGGPVTLALNGAGPTRTATLAAGPGWSPGTRTASVTVTGDDANVVGTFPLFTVNQPCTVTSAAPTTVEYRPLGAPVTYRFTMSGACSAPLTARFTPSATPVTLPLTQQTANDWTTPLPTDVGYWTPGRKAVGVFANGINVGTVAVTAVPAPCELVGGTTNLPPRSDASARLLYDLQVQVTTTGVCGRIGVSVPTGVSEPPVSVDPLVPTVAGGPVAWTTTLTRCFSPGNPCPGQKWVPGLRDVTVTNDDQFLGDFPLDLVEVCSMIGTSPGVVALGADSRLANPTPFSITTRGTCGTISLSIPTGGSPNPLVRNLNGPGPVFTRTFVAGDATWTPGTGRTVSVRNDGTAIGSFTLDVTQACAVATGTPLVVVTATSPRRVPADTTITVTTVGSCAQPVRVSLPTGSPPVDPLVVALAPTATPGTWTGTIRPADAVWTTSVTTPRTATVTANGAVVGTYFFVVSDCVVTSWDATISVSGSTNRVQNNERISYQTVGSTCGTTMTALFTPPGGSAQQESATLSSGTWRTDDLGGTRWNDGQAATVSIYNSDTLFDASTLAGTFQVNGT